MNRIKQDIVWTFRVYAITLVLPAALSLMNILFCGIIGLQTEYGFLMHFKMIWIDYYFTGSLLEIPAWRWQLGILFCSFLFTKFAD